MLQIVQVVLPHVTSRGESDFYYDPSERYTEDKVYSFPHNMIHCLRFARYEFDINFMERPGMAKRFIEDESFVAELKKMAVDENVNERYKAVMMLRHAETMMITKPIVEYAGCVAWARAYFEERNNDIRTLISDFPENATYSSSPFWRPPRRFPSAFSFDPKDPLHQSFVASAAILKV
jgi:hypothetical protein